MKNLAMTLMSSAFIFASTTAFAAQPTTPTTAPAKTVKAEKAVDNKTASLSIARVTVSGKRMSDEQKAEFDRSTRKAAKAPQPRLASN